MQRKPQPAFDRFNEKPASAVTASPRAATVSGASAVRVFPMTASKTAAAVSAVTV